jgi:hypothetical protein
MFREDLQAKKKGLDLSIAWVEGDDLMSRVEELLRPDDEHNHLDTENNRVVDKNL